MPKKKNNNYKDRFTKRKRLLKPDKEEIYEACYQFFVEFPLNIDRHKHRSKLVHQISQKKEISVRQTQLYYNKAYRQFLVSRDDYTGVSLDEAKTLALRGLLNIAQDDTVPAGTRRQAFVDFAKLVGVPEIIEQRQGLPEGAYEAKLAEIRTIRQEQRAAHELEQSREPRDRRESDNNDEEEPIDPGSTE